MDSSAHAVAPPENAQPASAAAGWRFLLRALRHRNYRLFFIGNGISLIGTWLTTTATSWLVLRLAHNLQYVEAGVVLGAVRFAAQIPLAGLAPAAGVLIDRWNRHRVLVVTQALSLLQSAALAWLTFGHTINVPGVIALSIVQGLINAFDAPARQAFVVEIINNRDDLPNAIALNSSMFNGARLVGPALAGLMIYAVGEAWCFAIDAISYLAVLVALLLMTGLPVPVRATGRHPARDLLDGLRYAGGFAPVRSLLILTGLISFTVAAFQTLMPIFAEQAAAPGQGARLFGFMGAAVGVGAFAGAVYLASRRTVVGLGKIIAAASALVGVSLLAFSATHILPVMLIASAASGLGMIITFAASNTLLQTITDDHMRGRLMSLFVVAVMGAAPLGSLIAGWAADYISGTRTNAIAGVASLLAAGWFWMQLPALRPLVIPIYVRKGIIREVAAGLDAAVRVNTADEQ